MLLVDENVVATGDDEGTLKVWDMRKDTTFMSLKHHEDYISDITADSAKRTLLTSRYANNSKETPFIYQIILCEKNKTVYRIICQM